MENITQPFVNLATADAELIARFSASPEMAELANATAQQYLELAQKAFGGPAVGEAHIELVRSLSQNYSTFAREHAQSLMGIVAEGPVQLLQQVQAATGKLTASAQAAATAVEEASKFAGQTRTE